MTRLKSLIPAVLAVCTLPVFAQKNPCDLLTQSEAAAIVGSAVDKQAATASCTYKVKSSTVALHVRLGKNNTATSSLAKTNAGKTGGVVKDEPSLGNGSYSATWPSAERLYLFKGDQLLRIDYVDTSSTKIPDSMQDKLRAAGKTALGRL